MSAMPVDEILDMFLSSMGGVPVPVPEAVQNSSLETSNTGSIVETPVTVGQLDVAKPRPRLNVANLAGKIAEADALVKQIQALEEQNRVCKQELDDLKKNSIEVAKLYDTEKQRNIVLEKELKDVSERNQQLYEENFIKTYEHEQYEAQYSEYIPGEDYNKLVIKFLCLSQKLKVSDGRDKCYENKLLEYCRQSGIKVTNAVVKNLLKNCEKDSRKTRKKSDDNEPTLCSTEKDSMDMFLNNYHKPSVITNETNKICRGTQYDICKVSKSVNTVHCNRFKVSTASQYEIEDIPDFIPNTPCYPNKVQEIPTTPGKQKEKKSVKCQTTQHKQTTITRSTTTDCFIKKHDASTMFPDFQCPLDTSNLLKDIMTFNRLSVISPIKDKLEKSTNTTITRSYGTTTGICNLGKNVEYKHSFLINNCKNSSSRPNSSIKYEAPTTPNDQFANTCNSCSFLPSDFPLFLRFWQVASDLLYALLKNDCGSFISTVLDSEFLNNLRYEVFLNNCQIFGKIIWSLITSDDGPHLNSMLGLPRTNSAFSEPNDKDCSKKLWDILIKMLHGFVTSDILSNPINQRNNKQEIGVSLDSPPLIQDKTSQTGANIIQPQPLKIYDQYNQEESHVSGSCEPTESIYSSRMNDGSENVYNSVKEKIRLISPLNNFENFFGNFVDEEEENHNLEKRKRSQSPHKSKLEGNQCPKSRVNVRTERDLLVNNLFSSEKENKSNITTERTSLEETFPNNKSHSQNISKSKVENTSNDVIPSFSPTNSVNKLKNASGLNQHRQIAPDSSSKKVSNIDFCNNRTPNQNRSKETLSQRNIHEEHCNSLLGSERIQSSEKDDQKTSILNQPPKEFNSRPIPITAEKASCNAVSFIIGFTSEKPIPSVKQYSKQSIEELNAFQNEQSANKILENLITNRKTISPFCQKLLKDSNLKELMNSQNSLESGYQNQEFSHSPTSPFNRAKGSSLKLNEIPNPNPKENNLDPYFGCDRINKLGYSNDLQIKSNAFSVCSRTSNEPQHHSVTIQTEPVKQGEIPVEDAPGSLSKFMSGSKSIFSDSDSCSYDSNSSSESESELNLDIKSLNAGSITIPTFVEEAENGGFEDKNSILRKSSTTDSYDIETTSYNSHSSNESQSSTCFSSKSPISNDISISSLYKKRMSDLFGDIEDLPNDSNHLKISDDDNISWNSSTSSETSAEVIFEDNAKVENGKEGCDNENNDDSKINEPTSSSNESVEANERKSSETNIFLSLSNIYSEDPDLETDCFNKSPSNLRTSEEKSSQFSLSRIEDYHNKISTKMSLVSNEEKLLNINNITEKSFEIIQNINDNLDKEVCSILKGSSTDNLQSVSSTKSVGNALKDCTKVDHKELDVSLNEASLLHFRNQREEIKAKFGEPYFKTDSSKNLENREIFKTPTKIPPRKRKLHIKPVSGSILALSKMRKPNITFNTLPEYKHLEEISCNQKKDHNELKKEPKVDFASTLEEDLYFSDSDEEETENVESKIQKKSFVQSENQFNSSTTSHFHNSSFSSNLTSESSRFSSLKIVHENMYQNSFSCGKISSTNSESEQNNISKVKMINNLNIYNSKLENETFQIIQNSKVDHFSESFDENNEPLSKNKTKNICSDAQIESIALSANHGLVKKRKLSSSPEPNKRLMNDNCLPAANILGKYTDPKFANQLMPSTIHEEKKNREETLILNESAKNVSVGFFKEVDCNINCDNNSADTSNRHKETCISNYLDEILNKKTLSNSETLFKEIETFKNDSGSIKEAFIEINSSEITESSSKSSEICKKSPLEIAEFSLTGSEPIEPPRSPSPNWKEDIIEALPHKHSQLHEKISKNCSLFKDVLKGYHISHNRSSEKVAIEDHTITKLKDSYQFYLLNPMNNNENDHALNFYKVFDTNPAEFDLKISALVSSIKDLLSKESHSKNRIEAALKYYCNFYPEFRKKFLFKTEKALFNEDKSFHVQTASEVLNLLAVFFFVNDIYIQDRDHPAKLILAKCLYYYGHKVDIFVPMIIQILSKYPTVLPNRGNRSYDNSDPLITVIKHILMCTAYDMNKEDHKILLSNLRYQYFYEPFSPTRREVSKFLIDKLRNGESKNLIFAFILYAKRLPVDALYKHLILGELFPLALSYYSYVASNPQDMDAYEIQVCLVLEVLSMLLKTLSIDKDIEKVFKLFISFLNIPKPAIRESAIQAILRVQKFSYVNVYNALHDFQPTFPLKTITKAMVKYFIYQKSISFWKSLQKHYSFLARSK